MDTDKRRMFFDKADLISSSFIYPFLKSVFICGYFYRFILLNYLLAKLCLNRHKF